MTTMMNMPIDRLKLQQFMNTIMNDMSGGCVSIVCSLGDKLGLFKTMVTSGPLSSSGLAERAGINERYAREWLNTLVCAQYIDYDPATECYSLPPEHAMALAAEGSPMFMGGAYQQMPGLFGRLAELADAFRTGGGIAQAAYSNDLHQGMERISAGWFDNLLVQQWIAAMPELEARLKQGIGVADIGCGGGRAAIALARAYPNSRVTGYDQFEPSLERARANAARAGAGENVRFVAHNALEPLPEQYDLITTFDSLHDFTNVQVGVTAIHGALRPGGSYLILEMNCSEKLEANIGPVGAMLYSTSVLYNVPASRAEGGDGLGTMGLPESEIRCLATVVGFSDVERIPIHNPFNALYHLRR